MKKLKFLLLFSCVIILSSCGTTTVKKVGIVNMISNRNVDSDLKYERITTYSGASEKELKKSRSETIEDAVDKTVRKIPGGEFLMNVKIFLVEHKKEKFFAVEGDVWGKSPTYRGFKVGDRVTWKNKLAPAMLKLKKNFLTGVIKGFKDDKTCLVKQDDKEVIIELSYDDITKIEQ